MRILHIRKRRIYPRKQVNILSKQKVRGIVIESKAKGENDKWLTVLCKDIGKITVKSRSCRKPNSKLFGCSGLFSYCDYIIDDHLGFYQLVSGDDLKHFFIGCDDLKKISLANYFVSLSNKMLKHGQADNEFMYFLLKGLQMLDKENKALCDIGYIFELRSLIILGFMPYTDECSNCGSSDTIFFSPEGALCKNCVISESIKIDPETFEAIDKIFTTPIDSVFKLRFDSETKKQLSACAALIMRHYMKTSFTDYDMYKYEKWY